MMEAIDALVQIVRENKIRARDVAKVVARLPGRGARLVNNRRMPDVNIQYILSAILMDEGLTFAAAHDLGRMQDRELLDVKERVQLVADDEFERAGGTRYQAIVEVIMQDGRTFRQHRINCFGRPDNPMPPEEVEKKAVWLMEPVIGEKRTSKVLASVRNLEAVAAIRDLTGLLRPDKA
jgi:2-methylcitrate dehydratase PrpD